MTATEQIDMAIEALNSLKLFKRYYASSEPAIRHAEEVAKIFEGQAAPGSFRDLMAQALRKA